MLIDTTVTVGQNIRCFFNKKARGKVIDVNGFLLTVQWEDGGVVDVNRYNIIVMEPGH